MLETIKQLKSKGSILAISPHKDGCFLIDNEYEQLSYDHECKRIDKKPLVTDVTSIHRYSHAISISKEQKIFLAKAKSSEGVVLNLFDKEDEPKVVNHYEGYIEASQFSSDDTLISFGSQEGRTYIYDAENMDYLLTLPPKNDYISKVCFSDNSRYLLSSCFNGSNVLYDFEAGKIVADFHTDATLEDALFFDNNSKIFYILRNGASGVYNINELAIEKQANTFTYWPTSIVTFYEDKYVCIGTKSKYLMLFDIEKNILISMVPLSFVGISSLAKKGNKLFVGFINGVVQIIDTAYDIDAFEVAYKIKDFKRLHQIVEKNIFLKLHPFYSQLQDSTWFESLPNIIERIAQKRHMDADILAEPYLEEENYKKMYLILKRYSKDIQEFYELFNELKINDVYMKVDKIPLLKYATPYVNLEKKWTTAFLKAKKLISIGMTEYKRAYRLLDPFIRIPSKKDLILALINQPELFFESESAVRNQKFKEYFDYVSRYSFLSQAPIHAKIELLGESYMSKLQRAEFHWDFKKMKYYTDILVQFPLHKNQALLTLAKVKTITKLDKAVDDGSLSEVFDLIAKYPYVQNYEAVATIKNAYLETAKNAIQHAKKGDGKGAYRLLKAYWDIPQCSSKISSIMKLSYFNEMKKYYGNKKVDWPTSIGRYLERFGLDDDIKTVAEDVGIKSMLDLLHRGNPIVGLHKSAKRTSLLSAKS